jgi:hypothetical protein
MDIVDRLQFCFPETAGTHNVEMGGSTVKIPANQFPLLRYVICYMLYVICYMLYVLNPYTVCKYVLNPLYLLNPLSFYHIYRPMLAFVEKHVSRMRSIDVEDISKHFKGLRKKTCRYLYAYIMPILCLYYAYRPICLYAFMPILYVIYYMLYVICCMLYVICYILLCYMLYVICIKPIYCMQVCIKPPYVFLSREFSNV